MSTRADDLFRDLVVASQRLNAASDQIQDVVKPLNEMLKKLNIGVEAWAPVPIEGGGQFSLGYAKTNRGWEIVIHPGYPVAAFGPFNDAPRLLRLAALPYMGNLLEALQDETVRVTVMVEKAAVQANAIAAALLTATAAAATAATSKVAKS